MTVHVSISGCIVLHLLAAVGFGDLIVTYVWGPPMANEYLFRLAPEDRDKWPALTEDCSIDVLVDIIESELRTRTLPDVDFKLWTAESRGEDLDQYLAKTKSERPKFMGDLHLELGGEDDSHIYVIPTGYHLSKYTKRNLHSFDDLPQTANPLDMKLEFDYDYELGTDDEIEVAKSFSISIRNRTVNIKLLGPDIHRRVEFQLSAVQKNKVRFYVETFSGRPNDVHVKLEVKDRSNCEVLFRKTKQFRGCNTRALLSHEVETVYGYMRTYPVEFRHILAGAGGASNSGIVDSEFRFWAESSVIEKTIELNNILWRFLRWENVKENMTVAHIESMENGAYFEIVVRPEIAATAESPRPRGYFTFDAQTLARYGYPLDGAEKYAIEARPIEKGIFDVVLVATRHQVNSRDLFTLDFNNAYS